MRLAFWRWQGKRAQGEPVCEHAAAAPIAPAPLSGPARLPPDRSRSNGDLDLRAIGDALMRNKQWIIGPDADRRWSSSLAIVNTDHPALQIRGPHSDRRTRERLPAAEGRAQRGARGARPRSRDQPGAARAVARSRARGHQKNNLAEMPEFDPVLRGFSPLKSVLALLGIGRDPFSHDAGRARARRLLRPADRLSRSTSRASSSSNSSRAIPSSPRASPTRSPKAI